MNANQYRFSKSNGDVLDFATLKATEKFLIETGHPLLAQSIVRILANNGIEKPVHHDKIEELYTSYYRVDLSAEDIEIIVSMLCEKESGALDANSETTPAASYCASMLDRWNDLII